MWPCIVPWAATGVCCAAAMLSVPLLLPSPSPPWAFRLARYLSERKGTWSGEIPWGNPGGFVVRTPRENYYPCACQLWRSAMKVPRARQGPAGEPTPRLPAPRRGEANGRTEIQNNRGFHGTALPWDLQPELHRGPPHCGKWGSPRDFLAGLQSCHIHPTVSFTKQKWGNKT